MKWISYDSRCRATPRRCVQVQSRSRDDFNRSRGKENVKFWNEEQRFLRQKWKEQKMGKSFSLPGLLPILLGFGVASALGNFAFCLVLIVCLYCILYCNESLFTSLFCKDWNFELHVKKLRIWLDRLYSGCIFEMISHHKATKGHWLVPSKNSLSNPHVGTKVHQVRPWLLAAHKKLLHITAVNIMKMLGPIMLLSGKQDVDLSSNDCI